MKLKMITAAYAFAVGSVLADTTPIMLSLWDPVQFPSDEYDVMGLRLSALCECRDFTGLDVGLLQCSQGDFGGVGVGGIYVVKDSMHGMQIGGIGGVAKDVHGIQIAGLFNGAVGNVRGVQIGVGNYAGGVEGMQIGLCCLYGEDGYDVAGSDMYGLQVSAWGGGCRGRIGRIGKMNGVQASGVGNVVGSIYGVQIAGLSNFVPIGAVYGMQIGGLLNIANDLSGVQIGLVNWADAVGSGV